MCIQQNTHHHILNSKSEYNRCSIPRLSTRLGDNEYKKYEKGLEEEKEKEEIMKKNQIDEKDEKQEQEAKIPTDKPCTKKEKNWIRNLHKNMLELD